MQHETVVEVNEHNVQNILAQSHEIPVLFYFWSERDPEAPKQSVMLSQIANECVGKFILAKLNCDQYPMLAAQFGLQMLPTFYVFKNGQPVNGLQGPQTEETIKGLLQSVLPNDHELKFDEARTQMEQGNYDKAIALLKRLHTEWLDEDNLPKIEVSMLLTNALLKMKQIEEAEEILNSIPEKNHDPEYLGLIDHIDLLKKAAHSPEIESLEKKFNKNPANAAIRNTLALKLHDVGRNEEALNLLFECLEVDLEAGKGQIKKTFLAIISTLGQTTPLASQYRKKLYALMY